MSETKGLVKCVFGLLLAILVMVGGAFGLDVQVKVTDTETTQPEVVETTAEGQDNSTTEDVVEEEQSPVDSTQTEDEVVSADKSVDAEVTEPTDETKDTVTEKGEN
jgi:cytoskeletal protein RodZ